VLSVARLIWDPAFNLRLLAAALGFLWLFTASIARLRRRTALRDLDASESQREPPGAAEGGFDASGDLA
jgi:hypothetical protein